MSAQPINKISNGAILGLILIIICILLYVFNFQYNTKVSLIYYLVVFSFPLTLAISQKEPFSHLTKKEALKTLLAICTTGVMLYSLFWVAYLLFINPEFGDAIWQQQRDNLIAKGFDASLIDSKYETAKKFQSPPVMGITTFISLMLVAFIGSLLATLVKKEKGK